MTRTEEKFAPLVVQPVIVTYRFLMELQSIRVVSLHRSRVLVQSTVGQIDQHFRQIYVKM